MNKEEIRVAIEKVLPKGAFVEVVMDDSGSIAEKIIAYNLESKHRMLFIKAYGQLADDPEVLTVDRDTDIVYLTPEQFKEEMNYG